MEFLTLLDEWSLWLTKAPMFPLFDAVHFTLMILKVRRDPFQDTFDISRRHPLSLWFTSMLSSFAGGIIANFLLGLSPIKPFENIQSVVLATWIWYLMFYCPFDLYYRLITSSIHIFLLPLKEVQRVRKITDGVALASKLHPRAWIIIAFVGIAKGCGSGIMRNFGRLLRGVWTPNSNELLHPSFDLKASGIASILLILHQQNLLFAQISYQHLVFALTAAFICFKLSMFTFSVADPFKHIEDALHPIFFGSPTATTQESETSKKKKD